ncbi:MAG: aminoacyl-tRNA hydrolase [Patescibacteria group bacterium]
MLVVGLGNPGEKYQNNRHNAGFILINEFAKKWELTWQYNKKFNAEIVQYKGKSRSKDSDIILLKPQTFMNDSGASVSKALSYFNIEPANLLVIHDDVDLEVLQFKVSRNSSSAGHHGVQNIIDKIGTQDFLRFRVGIGRPVIEIDVEKYVLQDFPSDQLEVVKKQGIEHLLSSLNL